MPRLPELHRWRLKDWGALGGTLPLVAAIRLHLVIRGFRKTLALVERHTRPGTSPNSAAVQEVVTAVRRASLLVPGATCLTRALAARLLLARRCGVDAELRLGAQRLPGGGMRAHAWLEVPEFTIFHPDPGSYVAFVSPSGTSSISATPTPPGS
jgi:hypothetical protein